VSGFFNLVHVNFLAAYPKVIEILNYSLTYHTHFTLFVAEGHLSQPPSSKKQDATWVSWHPSQGQHRCMLTLMPMANLESPESPTKLYSVLICDYCSKTSTVQKMA